MVAKHYPNSTSEDGGSHMNFKATILNGRAGLPINYLSRYFCTLKCVYISWPPPLDSIHFNTLEKFFRHVCYSVLLPTITVTDVENIRALWSEGWQYWYWRYIRPPRLRTGVIQAKLKRCRATKHLKSKKHKYSGIFLYLYKMICYARILE
jgi:hypothetical protein